MAETATPTTPADNSAWGSALNSLLTTGSSIFTGVTNAQVAKANAKLGTTSQAALAAQQQQQSGFVKYALIGGGVLLAVVILVFAFRKK